MGRFVVAKRGDPGFDTLLRCGGEVGRVMLWAMPGGSSGCGHRLEPGGSLRTMDRIEIVLSEPLVAQSGADGATMAGVLRVEAH